MKKGFVFSLLLGILFITINFNTSANATVVAFDRHVEGFNMVLKKAENNPYYKYGVYSSRIIAVKNPEVYLQGDMLFAKHITSQAGYAKAYLEEVPSRYFRAFSEGIPKESAFDFNQVDFSKYQIVSTDEIFGLEMSSFEFLDERISPIHTVLKVKTITSLEGANLIYIKKRIEGSPLDETFIIFTKDKAGYVKSRDKYFDCLGKEVEEKVIKDPVLVFNEQSVWYPLMERDDSEKDIKLKELVKSIITANSFPRLNSMENELVDKLKVVSVLNSWESKTLASLYSVHYDGSIRTNNSEMSKQLKSALGGFYPGKTNVFINTLIMKIGDYLSPRTAYLSSLITNTNPDGLKKIEEIYLNSIGTEKVYLKEFSAWGHTWPCTLIENNIDDSFRTKGGHCVSQAINQSAILDLAGEEHMFVTLIGNYGKYNHSIVILPQYSLSYDNGRLIQQEYYKKINEKLVDKLKVDVVIINDQLLSFADNFIYTNCSVEEGYLLHKKVTATAHHFFGCDILVKLREPLDRYNSMFYKLIKMPN